MGTLPAKIRQFFVKEGIAGRLIVAASGGIDSTALLLALSLLNDDSVQPVAAHVNHRLRGSDSDDDEAFVRDLCARLGIPLHVADGTLDPLRIRERGIEAAAREIRYARLIAIRDETQARYVATAHQKNDQAETVLMRLLTGSGIAGLRGIHPVRDDGFVRPMLDVSRAEVEAFLREHGVAARVDRSNADPRFLRNRLRVILAEIGGIDALAAAAGQARAQWPILERAIDEAERDCAGVQDDATHFRGWPDEPWLRGALLQRHIRRLDPGARDFDATRIAAELDAVKRITVTKNLELLRKDGAWILRRHVTPAEAFEIALSANGSAFIAAIGATIHVRQPPTANRQLIQLPAGADPTFTVRSRRPGDRFHPLGMDRPKKLKDFLIDRKVDVGLRDRLPLLVWNGEIVWVAGVEISERFRAGGGEGTLYEVWTD